MINGIHHVGVSVADFERSLRFYARAAGLDPVIDDGTGSVAWAELTGADDCVEATLLRGTNAYLLLARFAGADVDREPPSVADAGITHVCSQAKDIDALAARYRGAGASFREEPIGLGTGTMYAYVRDPEHNVIELEGTLVAPATDRPWLAHVAMATSDIERLVSFYSDLLRRPVANTGVFADNSLIDKVTGLTDTHVKAAWIEGENQVLEFWQYVNPPTEPAQPRPAGELGFTHVCFEVDDIEAEHRRLIACGATSVRAPSVVPGAEVSSVHDPDGNLVVLLQLDAQARSCSLAAVADPDIVMRTRRRHPR